VKKATAATADRPWFVEGVIPGGAADRAGIQPGDRLLDVGGKPATLDRGAFESSTEQAAGTTVAVTIERNGVKKRVMMGLVRLLGT
jgi:C-terminal processing protease CtpA/Prc